MKLVIIALILFPLIVIRCSRNEDIVYKAGKDTIVIHGQINDKIVTKFFDLFDNNVKFIEIDSNGGQVSSAIRLAEIIKDEHLSIVVVNKCLSACASILFLAADSRFVESGSVVGLHGTKNGLSEMFRISKSRDDHHIMQSDFVAADAARELQIVKDRGINPDFLLLPYVSRGKACYQPAVQRDKTIRFAVGSERPVFFPSAQTFAQFGIKIENPPRDFNVNLSGLKRGVPVRLDDAAAAREDRPWTPQRVRETLERKPIYACPDDV